MVKTIRLVVLTAALGICVSPSDAQGLRGLQATPARVTLSACGIPVQPPSALPPANSGPVIFLLAPCFERQGGSSRVNVEEYLREIRLKPSRPIDRQWIPYDATAERVLLEDFQRLWKTFALQDLSVEVQDYRFANGVVGKVVVYHITEREPPR